MKKATIYDVAKKSGVSPKTVSRVINNERSVSNDKRESVLKAVEQLGYKPNNSARSLRNNRAYAIGLLYDNLSPAYILDLQAGLLSVSEKEQFNVVIKLCNVERSLLMNQITSLLDNSKVDGFVLSPPISDDSEIIDLLESKSCPFVRIAPIKTGATSPYVGVNDRALSEELMEHLLMLGHQSIAFIVGDLAHKAAVERYEGYRQALSRAGIQIDKQLIAQGDFSFESGEICAKQLLSLKDMPSAIFASNDEMAAGVLKAARQMSILVPEQLSIVGFDDAPVSKQLWPTLTTVRQPVKEMAAQSAKLLLDVIQNKKETKQTVELTCELVIRESTVKFIKS